LNHTGRIPWDKKNLTLIIQVVRLAENLTVEIGTVLGLEPKYKALSVFEIKFNLMSTTKL